MPYDVDYPNAEYHEIVPNLFMGGHVWMVGNHYKSGKHSTVSEDESWDYVVSAYIERYEQTHPQCDSRLVIFDDTEKGLDDKTWAKIRRAVDAVYDRWTAGQKILIRCQAGLNRSGMLTALVLMRLGFTADVAIRTLREKRSPDVLVNRAFERYVHEREEEYWNKDIDDLVKFAINSDARTDKLLEDVFKVDDNF